MAYTPYAFLSYLSPLVTILLAYFYFNKKTLPGEEQTQAVYGAEPDDAHFVTPQLSA